MNSEKFVSAHLYLSEIQKKNGACPFLFLMNSEEIVLAHLYLSDTIF